MEARNRTIDRKFFVAFFKDSISEFAYEELEQNDDWFDGYPDRSDSTKEEIVRERFDEFTDMLADTLGWNIV